MTESRQTKISILILHMEDDWRLGHASITATQFQSTPLYGGRQENFARCGRLYNFNPRPPHGGRQREMTILKICAAYFNPRPPYGGRQHD